MRRLRFQMLWICFVLKVPNFARRNCEFLKFLCASRAEAENPKFGQKLNNGFNFTDGLMENLNLVLHCFAMHHCIVFHSISHVATPFNASHPMLSQALPCSPLHYTLYWCSLYPTLPCLPVCTHLILNLLSTSSMKYRCNRKKYWKIEWRVLGIDIDSLTGRVTFRKGIHGRLTFSRATEI